ncbi:MULTISPECIES: hypothetical protein [unclassified Spirosoma]|uniref:hypothetical protein n=1 Tax=unclassified Spirosoma TaxID=2621999 RepID=UPI00096906CF|nr:MULTISPECIES: hypothetical protein [unclassified Spirosoma]MBN8821307.1 hypothetical protein [Spirosoma sp.]OJW78096.1 MAG: hypothetical protein BGO59_29190 [Spirosoma sp. 48-14]
MKPEIKLELAGTNEIIFREGKALEVREPLQLDIEGVLDSPLQWLSKRVSLIDQKQSHILVNRDKLSIKLDIGEQDYFGPTIEGKLELHPMFVRFGINTERYLSNFDMAKLFKMNRSAFEVQSTAMSLVSDLQNFKAKVQREIEKATDNRGNATDLRNQAVQSNLPESFNLNVPIFKGTPKRIVEVEVYIKPDDLSCTLVSAQANDLIEEMRDFEIDKVLDSIREIAPDIAIIEQ